MNHVAAIPLNENCQVSYSKVPPLPVNINKACCILLLLVLEFLFTLLETCGDKLHVSHKTKKHR